MLLLSLRWQMSLPHLHPKSTRKAGGKSTALICSHLTVPWFWPCGGDLAIGWGLLLASAGQQDIGGVGGWHEIWMLQSLSLLRGQSRYNIQGTSESGGQGGHMFSPFIVVKVPGKNLHCRAGRRGSRFLGARVIKCRLRDRSVQSSGGEGQGSSATFRAWRC